MTETSSRRLKYLAPINSSLIAIDDNRGMKFHLPVSLSASVLLVSFFNVSCATRHAGHRGDDFSTEMIGAKAIAGAATSPRSEQAPDRMLAMAHEIVPGFEIEEVEREREGRKVSWSFEGTADGREIELEIEEDELAAK